MSLRLGGTTLLVVTVGILAAACGDDDGNASNTDGGDGGGGRDADVLPGADCAESPLRTTGTIGYYCDCQAGAVSGCVPGDDANAGTSPDAPRRTLGEAHARFGSMAAGDTVALCRGGVWNEDGGMAENGACTVASPCDYRDYTPSWASADTARPLIHAASGSNVFHITTGGGYRFWNLAVRTDDNSVESTGLFRIYGSAHDIDICNVRLENAKFGVLIASDTSPVAGVTVRHSEFFDHRDAAIFGGAEGFTIDSNVFQDNGLGGSQFEHTIYLASDMGTTNSGMRVTNNSIQTGDFCQGVQLVVHGHISDLLIANNRIVTTSSSFACFGIQLAAGYGWDQFNRLEVRRNRVTTINAEPIHVDSCVDCAVTDNVVTGGNLSLGTTGCESGTTCTQNLVFVNNTIYEAIVTLGDLTSGAGFTFANNVIWSASGGVLQVEGADIDLDEGNFVRASDGPAAEAVFMDAASGDLRPVAGGPLDDAGSQTTFSPTAIGSAAWDPQDEGRPRVAGSVDVGAF